VTEVFAFVDESLRPGRYLLACVVIGEDDVGAARRQAGKLLLRGQRTVHFQDEGDRRRRAIIGSLAEVSMAATVYSCRHRLGRGAEAARAACLATAVTDLQATGKAVHLLIESRDTADRFDRATIVGTRERVPHLTFEHVRPTEDPLLWVPDCLAWAVGAGGEWRRRVADWTVTREVG
jgi:hypothetical protein